jgi:hypothetical protein
VINAVLSEQKYIDNQSTEGAEFVFVSECQQGEGTLFLYSATSVITVVNWLL